MISLKSPESEQHEMDQKGQPTCSSRASTCTRSRENLRDEVDLDMNKAQQMGLEASYPSMQWLESMNI